MSEVVDTLVIKVEGDGQSAIDTLNKVASSLEKISKATGNQNLGDLSKKLDSIEQTVNSFKTNSLAALNDIVEAISNLKKLNISSKIPDGIKSIGQAAKSIKESDISKIDQVADSLNGVKEAQNSIPKVDLSGVKSAAARTAKVTTSDKLEESKENISAPAREVLDNKNLDGVKVKATTISDIISSWKTRLSESSGWIGTIKKGFSIVGSVSKKAITSFFSIAKKGFSVLSSTIKSIGSGIKRAFSNSILGKFTNTLKSAFKGLLRIAKFRLFRTIVKSITQAFKTGIDNMYQYSKAFSGEYAKNMDRLASANLTFKNSIGAIIAPIVNAVTPFLDKLLTRLTEVGNKIAMLFAGLSGKSTYTKAIRATTEYAKANDKASKSTEKVKDKTEELKRSFAGLDEITVIGDNASNPVADSSIAGAADSSDTPNYTTMFEEAPVQIAGLSPKLLDSLKGIDWSGLGTFFGKKLNGILDGIDWATIQQKAKDFATRLYTFINGFVRSVDWTLVGKTIAESLKTGLIFLDTLINNLDFSAIGKAFGNVINGLADPENAKLLARVLVGWITGGLTLLTSMLSTIDWAKVSDTIIAFISNFDFEKVSRIAVNLLNAIAKALGQIKFTEIGKAISNGISKIDWAGLWDGVVKIAAGAFKGIANLFGVNVDTSKFEKAFEKIKEPVGKLLNTFKSLLDEILPPIAENLLPAIANVLSGLMSAIAPILKSLAPVLTLIINAVSKILEALAPILPVIGEAIGKLVEMVTPIIDIILKLITKVVEKLAPVLGDIFEILGEIFEAVSPFIEMIMETLDPVIDIIGGILEALGGVIKFLKGVFTGDWEEAWEGIKQIFSGIWNAIVGIVKSVWEAIKFIFKSAWEAIKQTFSYVGKFFSGIWGAITQAFKDTVQFFGNIFANAWKAIKKVWDTVAGFFVGLWNGIVNTFKGVGEWFGNIFQKAVSGIKNAFNGIKQWFSDLWQGIWNVIKTPINWIIDGINALIGGLNNVKIDVPDWVPVIGGKRFGFNIPKIPKLAEGGFPEDGLFFANHNELVGQFSNGKTAVANNEQIVEGISQGVSSANEEQNGLLKEQNRLLRMLLEKRSTIDVTTITNAMSRKNQRDGRVTVPVAT